MPYKSYDELIEDAKNDPKLVKLRVARAKEMDMPVVSNKNPGYGKGNDSNNKYKDYRDKAIAKRMRQSSEDRPKVDTVPSPPRGKMDKGNMPGAKKYLGEQMSKALESRMKNNRPSGSREDEIITKRKKVGY